MGVKYNNNYSEQMFRFAEQYIKQFENPNLEDVPYILTFTGKHFRHSLPRIEDVCIEDIAHALSQINRYTGHSPVPYPVAQHSVLVSYYCPEKYAKDGLHHDDSEAYYNDIARPLKRLPGMEFYRLYERMGSEVIQKKLGLGPEPEEVKVVDSRMMATEMRDLFNYDLSWAEPYTDIKIVPWSAEEAERRFLMRHYELVGESGFKGISLGKELINQ